MAKQKEGFFNTDVVEEKTLWSGKKRRVFFGLPWTFTRYKLTESKVVITSGFLRRVEEDISLFRIADIGYSRTAGERLFGLGTVCIMSSDISSPKAYLAHIKKSQQVKELILQLTEQARIKNKVTPIDVTNTTAAPQAPGNGLYVEPPRA